MSVFVLQMLKSGTEDWGMRCHRGYWIGAQGKTGKGARSGYVHYQKNLPVLSIVNQLGGMLIYSSQYSTIYGYHQSIN